MRSGKQNRPSQALSFWDQLDQDIDKIGTRAKDKLINYQTHQNKTIIANNPQSGLHVPTPPSNLNIALKLNIKKTYRAPVHRKSHQDNNSQGKIDLINADPQYSSRSISISHRRSLQKLEKEEQVRALKMQNRLTYIRQDKNKQNRTIQLAKRKFQHIVTVRTQNFKQKSQIRKKLMSIDVEDRSFKDNLVKEVKSSEHKRHQSLQNWKSTIQQNAKQIRKQTANNQNYVISEKSREIEANIRKVDQTKKSLQRSRSIVSEARQRKINQTISYQKQQLSSRFQALNQQKKSNQAIFNKLKVETEKIGKWKSRAQKEIQQYRSYLGVSTKNSMALGRSKQSEKSLQSFYITHF